MKYGQNLEQYSVPQWFASNLDYNNLKKLVKKTTSSGNDVEVQAIGIPGATASDDEQHLDTPANDLYFALCEDLDRVELFCNTKHAEIKRRLDHHTKLLAEIDSRSPRLSSKRRLKRLSRIEEGTIKAGHELQLLSRFIGANRLGYVKILKKFTKWGGSVSLVERFRRQRLQSSKLFNEQKDPLSTLLSQYTNLLETIRAPFEGEAHKAAVGSSPHLYHDLQHAFHHKTLSDFDAVFASSVISANGGRAIYWIHQDNLIQAHVLMQSVSNQRRKSDADTPSSPTKATSPLNTFGSHWSGSGFIMCGKHRILNRKDIIDNKATIHYTTIDKVASLSIAPNHRLALKRKEVALLLQTNYAQPDGQETRDFKEARSWLTSSQEVKPLIEIGYTRTRFAGFSNSKTQGIWATLDNDVIMSKLDNSSGDQKFPHAILDIRWEGRTTPEIVLNLDRRVIAERIPNFDVTVHALSILYPAAPAPAWNNILQNNLRDLAVLSEPQPKLSRLTTNVKNSSDTTVSDAPVSPFSIGQDHSSATSTYETSDIAESLQRVRKDKGKKKPRLTPPREEDIATQPRYWNEFDDGDEDMQPYEPYTVAVQPEDEDVLVSMLSAFSQKVKIITRRIGLRKKSPEHQPLLTPSSGASIADSEEWNTRRIKPKSYSTFADQHTVLHDTTNGEKMLLAREQVLFHATWLVFVMAASFLATSVVIESISRKRYTTESRIFSVFGILMSFLMASLGMICMILRERLTLVGRSIIVLGFVVVCLADALLMLGIWQGA